jgi:hypothetical protein
MLLCSALAGQTSSAAAGGQTTAPAAQPSKGVTQAQATPSSPSAASPYTHSAGRMTQQANRYYGLVWGVDSLNVKVVESGELVRFSYYVLDPEKAKTLNDKKLQPFLLDAQAGVKLVVPQLEKVGMLRQSSTPEAGKAYWMAFSNKGGVVKRGDRVDVVIGPFKAEGLIVE